MPEFFLWPPGRARLDHSAQSKARAGPHQAPVCDPDLGFSPPAPPQGNQQPHRRRRPSPPTHHQRAHQNGIRLQTREARLCRGRGTQKVRVGGADSKERGKTGTLIPSDSGPGPGEPRAPPASPCPRELQPRGLAWSLLRRKPFGEALAVMPCDTLTGPTSLRDREHDQPLPMPGQRQQLATGRAFENNAFSFLP